MTFRHRRELPEALQQMLPLDAQEMYLETYNKVWRDYRAGKVAYYAGSRQEVAHRKAWAKVRQNFYRATSGDWRRK